MSFQTTLRTQFTPTDEARVSKSIERRMDLLLIFFYLSLGSLYLVHTRVSPKEPDACHISIFHVWQVLPWMRWDAQNCPLTAYPYLFKLILCPQSLPLFFCCVITKYFIIQLTEPMCGQSFVNTIIWSRLSESSF